MATIPPHRGWDFFALFSAFWKLLKGNSAVRFASLLVRGGVTLAMGPPIAVVIATKVFDVTFKQKDDWVQISVTIGPPILGVLLICAGIYIFLTRSPPAVAPMVPNVFTITVGPGRTFETAADLIVAAYQRQPKFEGFSEEDLARPVQSKTLSAPNGYLPVLLALGHIVQGRTAFPQYTAEEHGPLVVLRRSA